MPSTLDLNDVRGYSRAYAGFDTALGGWRIPGIMDAHDHVRDPNNPDEQAIFQIAVAESARMYDRITAMPNLGVNRILTGAQAISYRDRIMEEAQAHTAPLDVIVPFCVEVGLDLDGLERSFGKDELLAGKLYPENATTNSSSGVDFRRIKELFPLFALMQEADRILLVHAEAVKHQSGRIIEDRLREEEALKTIDLILESFPRLRVVFEHLTSRAGVKRLEQWQKAGYRIEATIAPQYLLWYSTALFERGMNPVNFSIPVLKDYKDQKALIDFVMKGGGMLGTDSAPHNVWKKSQAQCCPGGVFSAPVGVHVYFHLFRKFGGIDWFDRFVDFACLKAPRFYGLPEPTTSAVITETPWDVPGVYGKPGASVYTSVIPLLAGETVPTRLLRQ